MSNPVLFRHGTVLTMDDAGTVLTDADVLVIDDQIAGVGTDLTVPDGTETIHAGGGIVMPGMNDTHRHMWQTAMRGYGADWTLTQYFVWYYLEHGRKFRPQDVAAGNRLAAWEALEAGVTTVVDWSHGLQSVDHAEAAVDALASVPGRYVLAYGNIQAGPWEWTALPEIKAFLTRVRDGGAGIDGAQLAFDVTGDPSFPERAAFEVARELDLAVTTHAGVWGATTDAGIALMHENGFADHRTVYVHSASLSTDSYHRIAATGGSISVSTESEQSGGAGLSAHLAGSPARHRGLAVDGHQCVVERGSVLGHAHHAGRGPGPRALRGSPEGGDGDPVRAAGPAGGPVGHPRWCRRARTRRPGADRGRRQG